MRRILACSTWAILAASAVLADSPALAGDLPRELAQKYAPAAEKLRQFYSHATVSGTLKRELPQSGKSLAQRFVYRAAGVQVRLDVTTVANQGMGAKVGGSDMLMATGIGSLTTIRNPGSNVFDDAHQLSYADTKSRIDSTCLLTYPYTFENHETIFAFLQQPNVTITSVKKTKREGTDLVKVSFREIAGREDRSTQWSSYFVLSPDEGWAVREFSRSSGEGNHRVAYRGTLTYDGVQDGVPLVKRIECRTEQGPNRTIVARELVEVDKIVPGDPASHYFTAFDF